MQQWHSGTTAQLEGIHDPSVNWETAWETEELFMASTESSGVPEELRHVLWVSVNLVPSWTSTQKVLRSEWI